MKSGKLITILLLAAVSCIAIAAVAAEPAPPFHEHEVSFHNGKVTLKGTVIVPDTVGPHAGVVFLHGSGPSTRAGARPYAEAFAKLGLASLFFDKRGCGDSGGSWTQSSLDDLAKDALAAVACLGSQSGVDTKRIGLWGVSQAGWVETLAACQSPDIAFMVVISGGGATPKQSEMFSYRQEFQEAGLSQEQIDKANTVLDRYFHYLATGQGHDDIVQSLSDLREDDMAPLAKQIDRVLPSEANRPNWEWVASWDPAPCIEKIHCPILLMFGGRDTEQPTDVAVERWREGLAKAGNTQSTVMVFPEAGHGIRMPREHGDHRRAPFADGYEEAMVGWLWLHVIAPRN